MEIFKEDNVLTVTLHKEQGEQALDEMKSLSDIFNNSKKAKLYVKVCRKPVEAPSLDDVKISHINHEDLSSKSVKTFERTLTNGSDDIRKPIEELRSRTFNAKAEVRATRIDEDLEGEIRFLNRKLIRSGAKGFSYRIIDRTYNYENESTEKEEEFSSKEELEQSDFKKKEKQSSHSVDFNLKMGFSSFGLSAGITGGRATGEKEERKKDHSSKTTEAVLRKTVFIILRSFDVQISLDSESAFQDAKKISMASPDTILKAVEDFQRKYGLFLYTGPWVAGGSLEITARSTSDEVMTFGALINYSSKKTNLAIKGGLKAPAYAPVGASMGYGLDKVDQVINFLQCFFVITYIDFRMKQTGVMNQ